MAKLYPQLPREAASALAEQHGTKTVEQLEAVAATLHEQVVYSPTGGARISPGELAELAAGVRGLRANHSRQEFDGALARYLHAHADVTRSEAAAEGVWSFLGCVLLPDVVRWRFESDLTPPERFMGGARGLRNALGRCWWRGELLMDASAPHGRDRYWLLDELGDDELSGLTDRPRAVASRRVAVALAKALVRADRGQLLRTDLARDAFKRYLRLSYFVAFDALADDELAVACQSLYRRSIKAMNAAGRLAP